MRASDLTIAPESYVPEEEESSGSRVSEDMGSRKKLRLIKKDHAKAQRPANSLNDRLEALRVLALAILREVEAMEERTAEDQSSNVSLNDEVRRFEAELIRSALIRTGGRQRRAARILGMKVTTLNSKIKRYNLNSEL
jgi:DNA-binding NtrC family response regulator